MRLGSIPTQGKSQKPCSLDSREEGNWIPEAYRQSHPRDGERVTGPQRKWTHRWPRHKI